MKAARVCTGHGLLLLIIVIGSFLVFFISICRDKF